MTRPERLSADVITPQQVGSLCGLFRERVKRTPEALAYRQYTSQRRDWDDMNWRQMQEAVIRFQQALQRENLAPGDRVAVMLKNCREWVMFDIAALGLGLVVVPLYTDDRPESVAYILQNAGAQLLLTGTIRQWRQLHSVRDELGFVQRIVTLETIEDDDPRLVSLEDWLPATAEGELQVLNDNPHHLATIVYTSGTTGRPKGVMLSHRNILSNAYASQQRVQVYPGDIALSFLPLSHTLERTVGYYLVMMCGGAVAYNRSIPELAADLLAVRPTIMISVPRIFERVYNKIQDGLQIKSPIARRLFELATEIGWQRFELQQGRGSWQFNMLLWPLLQRLVADKILGRMGGRLRFAVCGGAPLPPAVARLFIGLGLPLVQGYGLTETSPVIGANAIADNDPETIGRPIEGIEVRIGENDELLARGPNIMLGYWDNPEATRQIIDDEGWLHTGDKAAIDTRGHIRITGRIKEIIVLANGEKVPPADMEMAIAMDCRFDQVMVLGEGRSFLAAVVVLNPDQWPIVCRKLGLDPQNEQATQTTQLEKYLLEIIARQISTFPGYAQIRRVITTLEPWSVEAGLITPTLKLKREQIEAHFSRQIEALYSEH